MNEHGMQGNAATDEDVIELLQYWTIIRGYKTMIAIIVGLAILMGVALAFLRHPKYTAEMSILPPSQNSSGMLGMISNMAGAMLGGGGGGGGIGGLLGGQKSTWESILKSSNVEDAIIKRFKLKEVYECDFMEETRDRLEKNLKIDVAKDMIMNLSFKDKDPKRAADILNAFGEELDRVNREGVMTSGKKSRIFLEQRVSEVELKLKKASDALTSWQEKNKVVDIGVQSQAIFSAVAAIKAQKIAAEVQLEAALAYSPASSPPVAVLKASILDLDRQMRQLEEGSGHPNVFIPISKVPNLADQYAWLFMDVTIQKTVLMLLIQQYEMAKIQEVQDTPTVQILDVAQVPEKSDRVKKGIIIIILAIGASSIFSVSCALLHDHLKKRKQV